jgi:hypothetical protein
MPRKILPKKKPVETSSFIDDYLGLREVEVWENIADAGERGSNKKRLASNVTSIVSDEMYKKLTSPNLNQRFIKNSLNLLLKKRNTSAFTMEVKVILKSKKIKIGKTLIWKVALAVRESFKAYEQILKSKECTVKKLKKDSQAFDLQEKIITGTF